MRLGGNAEFLGRVAYMAFLGPSEAIASAFLVYYYSYPMGMSFKL
jgi:hypothetical protein